MKDNILKFTIYGCPITKKNSQRIIKVKDQFMIVPSTAYIKFEKEFVRQCRYKGVYGKELDEPLEITAIYYMPTRRRVDLTNLLEATDDALQKAKVIVDDSYKIVCSHDGSRVLFDKDNPRTEITIKSYVPDIFKYIAAKEKQKRYTPLNYPQ